MNAIRVCPWAMRCATPEADASRLSVTTASMSTPRGWRSMQTIGQPLRSSLVR